MSDDTGTGRRARMRFIWPALLVVGAGALVLFPFDWPEGVWPAYGVVFDVIFATPLSHMIGHVTLFLLAGLIVLAAAPVLMRRPGWYALLGAAGALAEEGLQSLAKRQPPVISDGRDLLMDAIGLTLAFLFSRLVFWRFVLMRATANAKIKRGL